MNLWFANAVAYWLQVAVISLAAAVVARTVRVRSPECALACWQALLCALMLLPVLELWRAEPAAVAGIWFAAAAAARVPSVGPAYIPVVPLLSAIVVAGIAARLMWLGMGYLRLCRWRRAACPLGTHHAAIEPLRAAVHSPVAVYVSSEVAAPVTFGLRHAAVLLPVRWLDLDLSLQSAIVCHEFLHVRRRDWGFHVAEEITRALGWFHPAVWWLTAEIRLAREQVIDRRVVRLTGARRPYIEALLAFARVPADSPAAAAAFSSKRHLASRISSMFEEGSMKKSRMIVFLASITLCLVAAGTLAIRVFPLQAQDRQVHRVSEPGVIAPKVLSKVDPNYTPEAKDAKVEGTVVVDLEVHPDGRAHNIRIQQPLDPGLDKSALDAVSAWRFQPATKNGKPIAVKATIEINFKLT
jgi:TonB family protein